MQGQANANQSTVDSFDQLCQLVRPKLQELISKGELYAEPFTYIQRLEYELGVFKQSGYSGILCIIADYIQWAIRNNVVVGPGRGSAAGSLVVYLAGITVPDPIRYGLLFERFLNPDRISLPDIDTDFSSRDSVIGYLKDRYGNNRLVKVGVPSLFKPRSAIDEFSRVLEMDFSEAKRINKLVGDYATFDEAIAASPDLAEYEQKYDKLFKLARQAQGYVRMTTTHPSAVILTAAPVGREIPLQRSRGDAHDLVTQWDGEELDTMGYVKLDVLTIDNLAIINNTIQMVGSKITFHNMPLDDKKTLNGFSRGETVGVFQFEEPKSVSILKSIKGFTFDDVAMVNACIRPGLDVHGLIVARNDPDKVQYLVPALEPILSETYGVILYQEQVMRMCVDLAGFTMAEADKFRKIIAKTANQRTDFSEEDHDKFRSGYLRGGNNPDQFSALWEMILACQTYIFNKAHAVCYAYIAYMDMYLKQHHPLHFMCAALQVRSREIYIQECGRMGIPILPPDVNKSEINYAIYDGSIRVGLSNIKHIGKAKKLFDSKPYRDEFDVLDKAKPTKKMMNALIYAGALDGVEDDRSGLAYRICDVDHKPSFAELAREEKDCLGFYLTYNPLAGFEDKLRGCVTLETSHPSRSYVGGMISKIHLHQAKSGNMAFLGIFTLSGEMEVLVWPSEYELEKKKLVMGNIIVADAKKTNRGTYVISGIKVLQNG